MVNTMSRSLSEGFLKVNTVPIWVIFYISTSRSAMDIILVSICGFVRALIFNIMVLGQYSVKVIV